MALDLEKFLRAYMVCALWSSTDANGEPLDAAYDSSDLSDEAASTMRDDCRDFLESNAADIEAAKMSEEQAGHDFWLTRNRHGAGFWDRGLGAIGTKLSEAARVYGSQDIYEGGDGKLYVQ